MKAIQEPLRTARTTGTILADLVDTVSRRRWLVAVCMTVTPAIAVAAAFLLPPVYQAEAKLRVDPSSVAPDLQSTSERPAAPDTAVVSSELDLIDSRQVARTVVDELGPEVAQQLTKPDERVTSSPSELKDLETTSLLKKLNVNRAPDRYIIVVSFRAKRPELAARVANGIADAYIAASGRLRTEAANQEAASLSARVQKLGHEVEIADAAAAAFKSTQGLASSGAQGTANDQRISALNTQLAEALASAAAANSTLQSAKAQIGKGSPDAISSVLNSATIVELQRQRTEVIREEADIATRYGPLHPETIKVRRELADLDAQMSREAQRIVSGLSADAASANVRAAALNEQLKALEGGLARDTRAQVTGDALQRQADAKRQIYIRLLSDAEALQQIGTSGLVRAQIISRAEPADKPVFPKKSLLAVLGVALGCVFAAAFVLLAEMLDTRVRTPDQIEDELGLPFIGSIPSLKRNGFKRRQGRNFGPVNAVVEKPMSSFSEAIRHLRRALVANRDQDCVVVAVTSALPGEGKSSTAAALARVMAISGDRALLIDCDLRRGRVRETFGLPAGRGVRQLLRTDLEMDVKASINHDLLSPLHVIHLGEEESSSADLFGSDRMKMLIDRLRYSYDFIILDSPPLLALADAQTLSALANRTILTVRWNVAPLNAVTAALERLAQGGGRVEGVVLVGVKSQSRSRVGRRDPIAYSAAISRYFAD